MAERAKITSRGGPSHQGREWGRIIETVIDQVESLLTAIGLTGDFLLSAMKPRPGSSHNQGLHVQRYDDSDSARPAVFLLAQPFGNQTCWLYRLQLPPGSDAKAISERIEASLQQRPREHAERANVVVPLQPEPVAISVSAKAPEPRINTEPKASAGTKSIIGMAKDAVIAAALLSHLLDAIKNEGNESTLSIGDKIVIDSVLLILGDGYSRQQAGRLLSEFVKQQYLRHDKARGVYSITDFGAAVLRKQGIEVPAAQSRATLKAPPQPSPLSQTVPVQSDHLQAMKEIMERALVYEEAQRAVTEQGTKLEELRGRLADLDRERNLLTKREQEALETLRNAERILADPVFKRAVEQRAEMRRLLGDK